AGNRLRGLQFQGPGLHFDETNDPVWAESDEIQLADMGFYPPPKDPVEFEAKPQGGEDFAAPAMGFRGLTPGFPLNAPAHPCLAPSTPAPGHRRHDGRLPSGPRPRQTQA